MYVGEERLSLFVGLTRLFSFVVFARCILTCEAPSAKVVEVLRLRFSDSFLSPRLTHSLATRCTGSMDSTPSTTLTPLLLPTLDTAALAQPPGSTFRLLVATSCALACPSKSSSSSCLPSPSSASTRTTSSDVLDVPRTNTRVETQPARSLSLLIDHDVAQLRCWGRPHTHTSVHREAVDHMLGVLPLCACPSRGCKSCLAGTHSEF